MNVYGTRQIDVANLLLLTRLEFSYKTGYVPHYVQYEEGAFSCFPPNLSLEFLIYQAIIICRVVLYCSSGTCIRRARRHESMPMRGTRYHICKGGGYISRAGGNQV